MISKEQLAEWERLANEATEGPWLKFEEAQAEYKDHRNSFDWWQIIALNKSTKMPFVLCSSNGCLTPQEEIEKSWRTGKEPEGQTKKDIAFIASAREAVPALIAEVRGLQKTLHAVSDTSNKLLDDNNHLEKEADWLATQLAKFDTCPNEMLKEDVDCFLRCKRHMYTKPCWRAYATKAVHNE